MKLKEAGQVLMQVSGQEELLVHTGGEISKLDRGMKAQGASVKEVQMQPLLQRKIHLRAQKAGLQKEMLVSISNMEDLREKLSRVEEEMEEVAESLKAFGTLSGGVGRRWREGREEEEEEPKDWMEDDKAGQERRNRRKRPRRRRRG